MGKKLKGRLSFLRFTSGDPRHLEHLTFAADDGELRRREGENTRTAAPREVQLAHCKSAFQGHRSYPRRIRGERGRRRRRKVGLDTRSRLSVKDQFDESVFPFNKDSCPLLSFGKSVEASREN